ncbi:MAG: helix-turn-helix transcriptional regulator [Marivivens sp.]|nr:helix-turn-helix transcriptional regulator [Marivivens sp.]
MSRLYQWFRLANGRFRGHYREIMARQNHTDINASVATVVMWGMGAAALFFLQDVVLDISDHLSKQEGYGAGDLLHLVFEILSVALLASGMTLLFTYLRQLRLRNERQSQVLRSLREDFDEHVRFRFEEWGLTGAEADVALLLLRGASTAEIAEYRKCSAGTVKVHSHNLFQKAGVASRVELMGVFLDEFIEVGMKAEPENAVN